MRKESTRHYIRLLSSGAWMTYLEKLASMVVSAINCAPMTILIYQSLIPRKRVILQRNILFQTKTGGPLRLSHLPDQRLPNGLLWVELTRSANVELRPKNYLRFVLFRIFTEYSLLTP